MDWRHCQRERPTFEKRQDHIVKCGWDGERRGVDGCDGTIVSETSKPTVGAIYSLKRLQWFRQIYLAPCARAA
jgi:hypothetical protein